MYPDNGLLGLTAVEARTFKLGVVLELAVDGFDDEPEGEVGAEAVEVVPHHRSWKLMVWVGAEAEAEAEAEQQQSAVKTLLPGT